MDLRGRTSTWRRSTPAWSTPASDPPLRRRVVAGPGRRCSAPTTSAQTWQETPDGAIRFPEGSGASVERVWQLVPGRRARRRSGPAPSRGAVWRSTDRGRDVRAGAAALGPPAPQGVGRGLRRAGRSTRSCRTPTTRTRSPSRSRRAASTRPTTAATRGRRATRAIRAEFLPEGQQYPEFGQCVHKVSRHPPRPERLYLQNHGGVYRSDDHGASWSYIADGLPGDFGFPIVVAPARAGHGLRLPARRRRTGGYPPEGQAAGLAVARRRRDLGGARQRAARRRVLRRRDARRHVRRRRHDPAGLYVGARNGAVCGQQPTTGRRWRQVVANLPDVMVRPGRGRL